MAGIHIQTRTENDGWVFEVDIRENGNQTTHIVTMSKEDYQRLTANTCSPEECVRKSFEFLLEREPKESILREFDITKIGYYFPEFESELAKRIQK